MCPGPPENAGNKTDHPIERQQIASQRFTCPTNAVVASTIEPAFCEPVIICAAGSGNCSYRAATLPSRQAAAPHQRALKPLAPLDERVRTSSKFVSHLVMCIHGCCREVCQSGKAILPGVKCQVSSQSISALPPSTYVESQQALIVSSQALHKRAGFAMRSSCFGTRSSAG